MSDTLMLDVRREAAQVPDLVQRQCIQSLGYTLQNVIPETCEPSIFGTLCDDGSFLIEWMVKYKRLGFSIEPTAISDESCWFMVNRIGEGGSGWLADADIGKLVTQFLALKAPE